MAFIQKFFSSYKDRTDGETLIGEINRLWYDSNTNTIRISDGNPGGKIVSGSGMGSTVYEGPTPPDNPEAGWLWWDSVSGDLFVYYEGNWVTAIPNSTPTGIDSFTSLVTTQITTLAVDMTTGPTMIFWQPSADGNRDITLSNFTAGRRVKIFITPYANNNTFTFTGVTSSQCSNGSITYVLGGGGVAQSSMMIEVLSTTSSIGGVWIFGSQ